MVPCSAKGCKATMGTPGIIFFRFPKDYLERGWMQMVNKPLNWRPKPDTRMCSLHFPPGCFSGRRLKLGANPLLTVSPVDNPLLTVPPLANPLLTAPSGGNPLMTEPPRAYPLLNVPPGANPLLTGPPGANPLVHQVAVYPGMKTVKSIAKSKLCLIDTSASSGEKCIKS